MKWAGRLMTSVATVLLTVGAGLSASKTEASTLAEVAWADAVQSNTLEAYTAFVMTHPESRHAQSAYMKLSAGEMAATVASAMAPKLGDDESPVSTPGFVQRTLMIV